MNIMKQSQILLIHQSFFTNMIYIKHIAEVTVVKINKLIFTNMLCKYNIDVIKLGE